jgi:hypothetical protein
LEKFQGFIPMREAHAFCVKFTHQPKPVVTFFLENRGGMVFARF